MANALACNKTLFESAATTVFPSVGRSARVPFDDSETEDIVLVRDSERLANANAALLERTSAASPSLDVSPAAESAGRPRRAPRRIGDGKLVAARVQWRPGDPFGQEARGPVRGFRWNQMVRSACVTAVCGLILVWLLHIA